MTIDVLESPILVRANSNIFLFVCQQIDVACERAGWAPEPPPLTLTALITVPILLRSGSTVYLTGGADPPAAMAVELVQSTMLVAPGQTRHDSLTMQDQPSPVAATTGEGWARVQVPD
jgi:hypothetical protein